jgi:hypothetical protein
MASFTSSSLLKLLHPKIPSMLGTSENHLGPSMDYMLDAQKFSSQTLEELLAFWQQHAGAHCRAGASLSLTIGPTASFEWHTAAASELHNTLLH